jgi:para-nitrobenzyl esterase
LAVALVACLATLVGTSVMARAGLDTIKTDAGAVSGIATSGGVTAFLGIPFGAPPIADLRWRPPQPVPHWEGVRKADHFGASCMQNQAGSRLPWTEEFMTQGPIAEDCLFVNVWTPAKSASAKLPVMFWIYGGGFNEGSSSVAVYDGTELAKKDVIIVSVNYRVGPIGFFVHPDLSKESEHHVSGNYGLLDQIAALQWVHKNISGFGGDPASVTIFGQSAGALSVVDLMRSPLAKGLFVRAIAQSGPGLLPANALNANQTLADREAAGARYADAKGAHTLAELRALPAASFFASTGGRGGAAPPNGPFKDGWVLPATDPIDQLPLIIGFVADDLGVSGGFGVAAQTPSIAAYQSAAQRSYGDRADEFLKLYPVSSDADVAAAQKAAGRDRVRVSMDLWAAEQLNASKRMYTYFFNHVLPWPAHPEFGAFHTSEVPYVFETLARIDRPWDAADKKLSDTVSSYWTNFAKKGDPNGPGLPPWPAYSPTTHQTMELGSRSGAMSVAEGAKLEFFLAALKK